MGVLVIILLAGIVGLNLLSGAYVDSLWPAAAFGLGFGLVCLSVSQISRPRVALALLGAGLFTFALLPVIVSAQSGAPSINFTVDDRVPEVGEEVTVTLSLIHI